MTLEEIFDKLTKEKKNDVNNLIKWMKESKIIDEMKESEDKARNLFKGVDQSNVSLDKFKEVLGKIAEEQKKAVEGFSKALAEQAPKALEALQAGAASLKAALSSAMPK